MTRPCRGGAPVGHVTELGPVEAGAVLYLRLWSEGQAGRDAMIRDFEVTCGPSEGGRAARAFGELCDLCAGCGRRPLMRHGVTCRCLGADESCFANLVAAAGAMEREDAMLLATLLVRPDVAPALVGLAETVGVALQRMARRADSPDVSTTRTLH